MIIESLKLTNFRNHASYFRVFDDPVTLILGPNGCGKTSILEAIFILLQGKSFRSTDPEIIKTGTPFYRIEATFVSGEKTVAVYETGKNKTFFISDQKFKRLPSKNRYPVVFFSPDDLNLISHAPSRRRTYFDNLSSQLFPTFSTLKNRYEKALKQRNELLKTPENLKTEDIFSWNLLLARYGTEIVKYRNRIIEKINSSLEKNYQIIAENSDQVSLQYQNSTDSLSETAYLSALEKNLEKDKILGHTTFGPHKDDFLFIFNHKPANGSASRGETRSIIIAEKFVETELLQQETGNDPLIMLDDVFSELDSTRRSSLTQKFGHHQIIITSVEQNF